MQSRRKLFDRSRVTTGPNQARDLKRRERRRLEAALAEAIRLEELSRAHETRVYMRASIEPPAYFADWRDVWEITGSGAEASDDCARISALQKQSAAGGLTNVTPPPPREQTNETCVRTQASALVQAIRLKRRHPERVRLLQAQRKILERAHNRQGEFAGLRDEPAIPPPPVVPSLKAILEKYIQMRLRVQECPIMTRKRAARYVTCVYDAVQAELAAYKEFFPRAIQREIQAQARGHKNPDQGGKRQSGETETAKFAI
jgi:hypothetical protein